MYKYVSCDMHVIFVCDSEAGVTARHDIATRPCFDSSYKVPLREHTSNNSRRHFVSIANM